MSRLRIPFMLTFPIMALNKVKTLARSLTNDSKLLDFGYNERGEGGLAWSSV